MLTEVRSDAKTFYNAGTLKYTRRFSDGLTILSSYTFSRASIRPSRPLRVIQPAEPFRRLTRTFLSAGLFSADRKHVWTTSAVYELPFGKGRKFLNQGGVAELRARRLAAELIASVQSGGAFAVTVQGGAARVNTGSDQRPNRPQRS